MRSLLEAAPARAMLVQSDGRIEADAKLILELGIKGTPERLEDLAGAGAGFEKEDLDHFAEALNDARLSGTAIRQQLRLSASERVVELSAALAPPPAKPGSVLVWLFVWQTRYGYALRVVGQNEAAAVYGGISPARQIMLAMTISGALAGLVALNMIMGAQHRMTLDFTGGFGFVGIAVALMGRNHPVGIILASLLFGALYQGGSELSFDMPALSRDLVVVIQGLVILFSGALEHMFRPPLEALFARPAPAGAVA